MLPVLCEYTGVEDVFWNLLLPAAAAANDDDDDDDDDFASVW